jgi:hypothetical protein
LAREQQRQFPASKGEVAPTVDLNGYQFFLACGHPLIVLDGSETFTRRTTGTDPNGIFCKLTKESRPVPGEARLLPSLEGGPDSSFIFGRERGTTGLRSTTDCGYEYGKYNC